MNTTNKTIEEILAQAIELYDNGTSLEEILLKFPTRKQKLQEFFDIIYSLQKEKNMVISPETRLQEIIEQVKLPVTKSKETRYEYQRGEEIYKGRSSFFSKLNLPNLLVYMNKKIYLVLGVIILIAGLFVVNQALFQPPKVSPPEQVVSPIPQEDTPFGTTDKLAMEIGQLAEDIEETDSLDEDELADLGDELNTIIESKESETAPTDTPKSDDNEKVKEPVKKPAKTPTVDTSSLDAYEQTLNYDMSQFNQDTGELDSINSDSSLDDLESGLSEV